MRIRAYKVLADLNGRTRYVGNVPEGLGKDAVEATFRHLETHLDDPTVARFHPELGFTHVSLGKQVERRTACGC